MIGCGCVSVSCSGSSSGRARRSGSRRSWRAYAVFEGAVRAAAASPDQAPPPPDGRRLGDSTSGRAGTAGGFHCTSRSMATPTRRRRPRSFPRTHSSSAPSDGSRADTEAIAGVVVSLVACAATFVLLYERCAGRASSAKKQPAGASSTLRSSSRLSFSAPSTASRSTCCSRSLRFCSRRRGRWTHAGISTGLAILTRPTGVMLIPALALLAWSAARRGRAFAGLALAVPIAATWPLWLWAVFGHPFEFLTAERNEWHRHLSGSRPRSAGSGKGSTPAAQEPAPVRRGRQPLPGHERLAAGGGAGSPRRWPQRCS